MRKVKITKEQYDRIFKSGLLKESTETKKEKPSYGGNDPIEKETKELISYFYRKSADLSPFWEEHGVSYEDICKALKDKKLITRKGDKYMVTKGLGSKEEAIEAVEKELRLLAKLPEKEIEMSENDNYPAGAANDPNAPWNREDGEDESVQNNTNYDLFVYNDDIAIFKRFRPKGFYLMDLNENHIDHEGPTLQDEDVIRFLNDNEAELEQYFIPLSFELINELEQMYSLNNFFKKRLEQIKAIMGGLNEDGVNWADTYKDINPEPKLRTDPENKAIIDKVRALKQRSDTTHPKPVTKHPLDPHPEDIEEMTSAAGGSSGAFTAPMNRPIKKQIQTVTETTVAAAGNFQYDTPGLVGVSRDGKYSKNPSKTKAEKTTQWAGGSFVEQPKCSKMDNNKEAQNGGCNSGASSLKTKKTGGSINAPSLGENTIFEEIAKQTGRTIEEVKKIIESKKQ
jgi:hypothetical protein